MTLSTFVQRPTRALVPLDGGDDVLLTRRDGEDLRMQRECDVRDREVAVSAVVREFARASILSPSEANEFAVDYLAALRVSASLVNYAHVSTVVQAWKSSAEIKSDPALLARIKGRLRVVGLIGQGFRKSALVGGRKRSVQLPSQRSLAIVRPEAHASQPARQRSGGLAKRYPIRSRACVSTSSLIRSARMSVGLSQRSLAASAGTSQPAIARDESGRADPRADTLERILAACGHRLSLAPVPARTENIPARGPMGRLLRRHHGAVLLAVERAGLRNPRLFGSVARGEDHHGSDIDILVDLRDDSDVLAIYELRKLLVPMLGDRVDVTCPEVLRKKVLARAIEEAVAL